jgi:predicted amidohydrolase YtcJ
MGSDQLTEFDRAPQETVYRDAEIVTGDPGQPRATGLWVRGDRIAGVGDADELVAAAGPGASVLRFRGSTIVPGLIDAHCHISMLAFLLTGADCSSAGAPDIAAILQRLAAAEPGGDGWVTGSGYAEYKLADRRHPTRRDLDEAVPTRPCVLFHTSLHTCIVNSAGLRELGLMDESPDPPQGQLGRDAAGHLDGRLLEAPMFDLLSANMRRHLESLDERARAAMVRLAGVHLASLGITSCSDAAADSGAFLALRDAERRGELPVRVSVMFTYAEAAWLLKAGMTTGFGSDRLRIGAVKLFCDGGMSSRTAAVDEPYEVPFGQTGLLWYDTEALTAIVRECDAAGFQVAVHAQGERGIRTTLAAYERAAAPGNPARHRIEHGGCFAPELRAIAARTGIHVVSQPGFLSALGDGYIEAFGPRRSQSLYPFAALRDAGVLVAGSSDAPVIGASPLVGMRDAILRRTDGGAYVGRGEALTPAEAFALYTRNAAYVGGVEGEVGSLEVGKLADLTVLDRNPLAASPETLGETVVELTVVAGQVAFDRSSATRDLAQRPGGPARGAPTAEFRPR